MRFTFQSFGHIEIQAEVEADSLAEAVDIVRDDPTQWAPLDLPPNMQPHDLIDLRINQEQPDIDTQDEAYKLWDRNVRPLEPAPVLRRLIERYWFVVLRRLPGAVQLYLSQPVSEEKLSVGTFHHYVSMAPGDGHHFTEVSAAEQVELLKRALPDYTPSVRIISRWAVKKGKDV